MIVTHTPQNQIRKAEKPDVPVIIDLAKATWEPTYRDILSKAQLEFMFNEMYSPASLETQMTSLGHIFLILYLQGKPSGYASYSEKADAEGVFKLQKLYLLPELQGKGLGRKLIEAAEEKVLEAGGRVLELNVNRYNPARNFYERLGFTFYQEEDIPIGEFWMNDFVMRKELSVTSK